MNTELSRAEAIIATVARLLKRQNKNQLVEVLIHCEPSIDWWGREDYGVDYGRFVIRLPLDLYEQIEGVKKEYERVLQERINELIAADDEEVREVVIRPKIEASKNWREELNVISNSAFGIPPLETQYEADVFMLMPFTRSDLEEVYRDHVVETVQQLDMTIKRGDDFFSKTSVVRDIWAAINAAGLIIADCTGKNPNVFYELGITHTLGKPVIMITQNEDDIPFDLRQWRYIRYVLTPRGMNVFRDELHDAILKLWQKSKVEKDTIDPNDIPF